MKREKASRRPMQGLTRGTAASQRTPKSGNSYQNVSGDVYNVKVYVVNTISRTRCKCRCEEKGIKRPPEGFTDDKTDSADDSKNASKSHRSERHRDETCQRSSMQPEKEKLNCLEP